MIKMKNITYILILGLVLACSKRTNPKKVERLLTKGRWQITTFVDNGKNIKSSYKDVSLSFAEAGTVLSTSATGVSGTWYVGSDKNPAVIYMTFPDVDSMNVLSDDWAVVELSKNQCILKRNLGKPDGKDKVNYEPILDNLTLVKNK
jgi:hypothetical protein